LAFPIDKAEETLVKEVLFLNHIGHRTHKGSHRLFYWKLRENGKRLSGIRAEDQDLPAGRQGKREEFVGISVAPLRRYENISSRPCVKPYVLIYVSYVVQTKVERSSSVFLY
jgi:hypothetical protein